MNVLLVDVDSKIPNLALMKIAAYHRSQGDDVGFNVQNPDKVYCSVVFKKNRYKTNGLRFYYPDAELDIGGSGYDLNKKLPDYIESMSPDYTIYPENDSFYGFTTRGCIRKCPFCIVSKKEGSFKRLYDTPEHALKSIMGGGQYNKITFLDNNILADKEWFLSLCNYLHTHFPKLKVDFNQGLDIRLLDDDIAKALSLLRPINDWKFAFDMISYKNAVEKGINILKKYMNVRNKCIFYVYTDGDYAVDDALERARFLKSMGVNSYAMINLDAEQTRKLKAFKRWTRPWFYWTCDFYEFYKEYS